jgi:alanyl-tRNA synthetase
VNRDIDEMGSAYPDLVAKRDSVREATRREDTRFRETLETGIKLLNESFKKGGKTVPASARSSPRPRRRRRRTRSRAPR